MGKNETAYVQAKLAQQNASADQYVTAYAPIAEFNTMIDAYLADHPGTIDVTYGMLSEDTWSTILMIVMMIAVIGFVFFIFMSQQGGGGGKVMNFGKSKARLYMRSDKDVTFKNVAGADEEKEELAEIVDFLKYPDRYMKLGARIPKGVLLVGPPGTGKTLLARATAGEAGVPFFTISGSDFVEMFVGSGRQESVICLRVQRKMPPVLYSLMKSMPSDDTAGQDSAAETMNGNNVESIACRNGGLRSSGNYRDCCHKQSRYSGSGFNETGSL